MKNIKVLILVILAVLIISFPLNINATQINPGDYEPNPINQRDMGELPTVTADILATIRNIGAICSVVIMTIIGLKYMLSSLEERAEFKENFKLYVVGVLLLSMATIIPSVVYDIMN